MPAPFGRVLTAMVTPFAADGTLDLDGAQKLASHLVDSGNDGLVVSGTTGESPTTSPDEQHRLLRAVLDAVGDRATVVAGVGTYDSAHSVRLAQQAQAGGAHGLLVVTPYYNRPPQAGIIAHTRLVADATDLPVMLYDIPVRTGRELTSATILTLAEHPRVVALKDAKGDVAASAEVIAQVGDALAWYSGDDNMTLPLMAVGAVGAVGVVTHLVGQRVRELVDAVHAGDLPTATRVNASLTPVYRGVFRTQGVITTKAALNLLGLPAGPVRLPLVEATEDEITLLRSDLAAGGVQI